jgi:23S rRNA (uracil1939-C5)-methyltransferase
MRTPQKGDTLELDIQKMTYGGQGLARIDNFVIFIRGAIPGDRVRAVIYTKRKGFAEARITELLSSSAARVEAPCPYSPYCGGCQWQNVRYEAQLAYKKAFIEESLEHIGGLKGVVVHSALPSQKLFQYRNKMEFSFSDRRWFLPGEVGQDRIDASFALGLHIPRSYHKILAVDACLLQEHLGNGILRFVNAFARQSGVPVYGIKSHQGFWRFLTLRRSVFLDEWMVNIVTAEERPEIMVSLTNELVSRFRNVRTVVNNVNQRKASVAIGQREEVFFGDGSIEDRIGPFTFRISANSFFQTNSGGAKTLYDQVIRYADLRSSDRVLDLYSGTGTIPLFLSGHAAQVVGMEISESAVKDAERNAEKNGIENCRFICGDIRETGISLAYEPEVVIVDPPRTGMHKDVLAQVLSLAPERIVYVSCNPATLARDLELMQGQYDIREIQPVDLFPQTYHIEAVARLVRRVHP